MFLLAIHFYRKLSPKLVPRTGNVPDIRVIDIGKVCNSLSAKHAEATLGLYSLQGVIRQHVFTINRKMVSIKHSNQLVQMYLNHYATSKPIRRNRNKLTCKVCINLSLIHILKTAMPRRYLNYDGNSSVKTKKCIENLPSTKDALHRKILRNHYITYLLKSALLPVVNKPDPTLYGWYYDEGKLLTVTLINKLPAPTNVIPLIICSCKSIHNSNRCRCKKCYLNCSDACKCLNCENVAESKYSNDQMAHSNCDHI